MQLPRSESLPATSWNWPVRNSPGESENEEAMALPWRCAGPAIAPAKEVVVSSNSKWNPDAEQLASGILAFTLVS